MTYSKSRLLRIAFIILGFLILTGPNTFAQKSASVKGTITDAQQEPLAGVNISLRKLHKGTSSSTEGNYQLENLPAGTHTLTFSFVGYQSLQKEVILDQGETLTLDITLEQQRLESGTITVTGTPYASDPLTTPADVDVLSGNTKFAQQQTSLGASLEELAGISTISTGSQVGKPVIRGLSGNRVRVLDDGVAMDFQQYGVRHGPNVDPFTSERIEVVRGAASVQYGSDALGGAVNVISNSIPEAIDSKPFVDGQVLSSYASNNEEWSGGLHLDGASGGWGFTGTLVRRSAGNITVPDIPNFEESGDSSGPKFTDVLDHTDYDQLNGSLGLGYQGNFGKVSAEYTRWKNEQNFLLPNGKGLGQNLENNVLQLKSELPLGKDYLLKPSFTYLQNLRQSNPGGSNAMPRSALPKDGPAFLDILLNSYTVKTELQNPPLGPFAGTVGIEYMYQDQNTRGTGEPLVPSGTVNNLGIFVFQKAEWGAFTLSAGARIDHRAQEAEPNAKLNLPDISAGETKEVLDQQYTAFSGSIGGSYQVTEQFAIASNIGRGFRAPSFFDLHVNGQHGGVAAQQVGNPDLEPELSLNTDLSLRWRSSKVTAKITGYRNAIQDYIFLVNTGEFADGGDGAPILQTTQGNARLIGLDASMKAYLTNWLQVNGTFATVKGENTDETIPGVDELPLLPATNLSGGIKLMQQEWGKLQNPFVKIDVKHAFAKEAAGRYEPFWQFGPAFPFGRASTDAYTLVNASLGFNLALSNRPIAVQLNANNLFDTAYRDFLDTYKGYALSPGRSVSMRVKVPFNIL